MKKRGNFPYVMSRFAKILSIQKTRKSHIVFLILFIFLFFGVLIINQTITKNETQIRTLDDNNAENVNNPIIKFFMDLFGKSEAVRLSPEIVATPTNQNVLCVYNNNSNLSIAVCDYYLQKRPGAKSLGLNIPDSAFTDEFKEVMGVDNLYQDIVNPVLEYGNQHLEITHLALAKDIPFVVITPELGRTAVASVIDNPLPYVASAPLYVGSTELIATFQAYANAGIHFNPDLYRNSSGEYTQRFVSSHVTGYTLDDIKALIDRAQQPASLQQVWVLDADADGFSVTFDNLRTWNFSLNLRNISSENIIVDKSNSFPIYSEKLVIGYVSPGIYHTNYANNYVNNPSLFSFNVSPRAVYSTLESYGSYTATGNPEHTAPNGGAGDQSKVVDAFSSNSFGGINYSNSFAGGIGAVEEPYQYNIFEATDMFFRNYAQGLTLAESAQLNHMRSPITVFGDPLMRLYDEELKQPIGGICSSNNLCLSGVCAQGPDNNFRCQDTIQSCIQFGHYNLGLMKNRTEFCSQNSILQCANSDIVEKNICDTGFSCRQDTSISPHTASCFLDNGNSCTFDSECYSNHCGVDLQGEKKCSSDNSCAIGQNLGEITSGQFACITNTTKRLCDVGNWTTTSLCQGLCSQGVCEEERNWFTPPSNFSIKSNQFYSIFIPVSPANYSLTTLFPNAPNGFQVYRYATNGYQIATSRNGLFSASFVIEPYEGIVVKSLANLSFLISGLPFTTPPAIKLKTGFNLVGIGACAQNYTAKTIVQELDRISSNCSLIMQTSGYGGPQEYWSTNVSYTTTGLKRNFKIYPYESFWIVCNVNTSLTWQPSCIIPACTSGENISCSEVANARVASGFADTCDLEGQWINVSTCQYIYQSNLSISNLNFVYDGNAKQVSVVTNPSGLNIIVTYNGSNALPINSGAYLVSATINDSNYEGFNTATLVINKSEQIITFSEISNKVVGDSFDLVSSASSGLPVSFLVVSGPATLSGNRLNVNAPGTIVVEAVQNGNGNYNSAGSVDRTINSECGEGFVEVGNECKPICTNFTYSNWSVCGVNSIQTRSVVDSLPNSCVGGNPILNQSCIYVPVICEANSLVACDSVSDAEVTGHKDKCNSDGTAYLNESTCNVRKYILARSDVSINVEGDKKVIRDSGNKIMVRVNSSLDNSVFDNVLIKRSRASDSKDFVIVNNLNLSSGQRKTIILNKKNSNSNAVCIRDEPNLASVGDITSSCFKLSCPGIIGSYDCELGGGNTFEVSGLANSGVIEDRLYCGDNICYSGETCSSCASDCGSCPDSGSNSGSSSSSSSSSGGSGSGGSGSQTITNNNPPVPGASQILNQNNEPIVLNNAENSKNANSNLANYIIGVVIFLAFVVLIVIVFVIVKSKKKTEIVIENRINNN